MKPILFNTEMVQAILEGRKTMRRVVKPQPPIEAIYSYISEELISEKLTEHFVTFADGTGKTLSPQVKLPYQPGDILWVRETWAKRIHSDNRYYYKADNNLGAIFNREDDKWRSPIFMPREAARIFLRVTDVRVERVQDIWMWVIEFERTEAI